MAFGEAASKKIKMELKMSEKSKKNWKNLMNEMGVESQMTPEALEEKKELIAQLKEEKKKFIDRIKDYIDTHEYLVHYKNIDYIFNEIKKAIEKNKL